MLPTRIPSFVIAALLATHSASHFTTGKFSGNITTDSPIESEEIRNNTSESIMNTTIKNIVIKGYTNPWIKENLELTHQTILDLSCTLTSLPDLPASVTGYWKKDGKEIPGSQTVIEKKDDQFHFQNKFPITDSSHLGNYSCVLDLRPEAEARFIVTVPHTEGREKPLISYEGDAIVMVCKAHSHLPNGWTWYRLNGTERHIINATLNPDKFKTAVEKGKKASLKIMGLTQEDSGIFWCSAIYDIGSSEGRIHLKVLSYTVPLKPFLAIAVEVLILVSLILIYEHQTKKKQTITENGKDSEHTEKLTSDGSNGLRDGTARHRNV
ncbi:embigin isoform X1 [Polypterus senegalus]|uniref:embigin isoform X1 n=1 Tax=Polypterus senegalus TaxID=55291 RepID=UPI0019655738|nr:embigin isoform X1 [Polypterus senegalus]